MTETTPEEQLAQELVEAQQKRMNACQKEIEPLIQQINAIAQKHGCRYSPQLFITGDGRIAVNMAIVNVA